MIAVWIRDQLWSRKDWSACLVEAAAALRTDANAQHDAARALELAVACELIVPNVTTAVEMYLLAWKLGKDEHRALARARQLCRELDDPATVAKIARIEHRAAGTPASLVLEGQAWLDADQPDRAVKPLVEAARANPHDPVIATTLATARQEWPDARGEVRRLEAMGAFLPAARIVHLLDDDSPELGTLLRRAVEAAPNDESAFALYQRWLLAHGDIDGLLAAYRMRGAACGSDAEIVDLYRRAGTTLVLRAGHRGGGVRLLGAALSRAYEQRLQAIPGHLAMVSVLLDELARAGAADRLLPYLDAGLESPTSDDERLWLAVQAAHLTWTTSEDVATTSRYAQIALGVDPSTPLLDAIDDDGALAMGSLAADVQQGWGDDHTGVDLLSRLGGGAAPAPPAAPPPPPSEPARDEGTAMGAAALAGAAPAAETLDLDSMRQTAVPAPEPEATLPPADERRGAPRVAVLADANVSVIARVDIEASETRVQALARDVSRSGMFLLTDAALPVGSELSLVVHLPGDAPFNVATHTLRARIVRSEPGVGVGVQLIDPPSEYLAAADAIDRAAKAS